MYIRQATRTDLGEVLTCLRELNKEHVNYFTKNSVKWLLKNKCVVVCVSETQGIIGTVIVEDKYGDTFEIFAIAVHPTYQRSGLGIGSKLLRFAEAMARACGREIIYADSYAFYNATSFYVKNGYNRQDNEFGYTFYKYQDCPLHRIA